MGAIHYTALARQDLIDLWLELSHVNPVAADEFYNRLEARVEILRRFPASGQLRPDIAPEARSLVEAPVLFSTVSSPKACRSSVFFTALGISTVDCSPRELSEIKESANNKIDSLDS